jgi:hypothetical protein
LAQVVLKKLIASRVYFQGICERVKEESIIFIKMMSFSQRLAKELAGHGT